MKIVTTPRTSVASGHPLVTEAACEILRTGGNAFDAAVAAGFASAVAEPALTSLGGGGFLLARTAQGKVTLFDFFVDTPGRGLGHSGLEPHFLPMTVHFPNCDQVFNIGLGSAAVPGNLRGYLYIHERLGRLPLAEIVKPAVQMARNGILLTEKQAYFLKLLRPLMTLTPAGRKLFEPHGRYLQEGDRYTNPELAAFLETLPHDGDRDFYQGQIARRIDQDMKRGHGLITVDDLAAYRVIERQPLLASYRRFCLLTNPPPCFGGSLLALSLRFLETQNVSRLTFGSPSHASLIVAVMVEAERHRREGFNGRADLGENHFAEAFKRIAPFASGGTTHISVCDSEGNAASMTTSNGEGSGYLVPGTGIMLNNMLGEDDLHPDGFHASPPGLRVASMMSPSLLLENDHLRLVIGSGGSKRIRSAMLQVISNVLDFGMSLQSAVDAPRLHWDGDCVQAEPGYTDATLDALRRHWRVNQWTVNDVYFGGVNAVTPYAEGAGDPRRGGYALVLD
jgi:gamma-glutamyltranspeptidase/glutathione hydrolase